MTRTIGKLSPPPEAVSDRDKCDKPMKSAVSCVASVNTTVYVSVYSIFDCRARGIFYRRDPERPAEKNRGCFYHGVRGVHGQGRESECQSTNEIRMTKRSFGTARA